MATEFSYSLCPMCNRWVPSREMEYDYDEEENILTRVCTHCLWEAGLASRPPFNWEGCVVQKEG